MSDHHFNASKAITTIFRDNFPYPKEWLMFSELPVEIIKQAFEIKTFPFGRDSFSVVIFCDNKEDYYDIFVSATDIGLPNNVSIDMCSCIGDRFQIDLSFDSGKFILDDCYTLEQFYQLVEAAKTYVKLSAFK